MRTDCHLHSVQLRDISVKAGHDTLLSDVSFDISCGELVAVIGQNGAGKSTLFRSMLGEVKYSGSIKFLGHDGESANIVNVGYVPQATAF